MSDVTRILSQIEQGDPQAPEKLLPLVYEELRKLAGAKLAQEKPGQTLQATALVHEAYLRLVVGGGARDSGLGAGEERSEIGDQKSGEVEPTSDLRPLTSGRWDSRGHFFAAAAEAMRRILIEAARRKGQVGRGGGMQRVALEEVDLPEDASEFDLVSLDESLSRLEAHDSLAANLVKLRYFAGLTMAEAAAALGIPLRTAERNWTYARTWLRRDLG